MIKNRLILIYGAGSGFGKSTLGLALSRSLLELGQEADFFEEHDISGMKTMDKYVSRVHDGDGDDTETLLACCGALAAELLADGANTKTVIMDSLLPGWDWLSAADCDRQPMHRFTIDLCSVLKDLNPLLVIVEGDIHLALSRACKDRGDEWGYRLADARTGERSMESLLKFFEKLRTAMEEMLPFWKFTLVRVNTTSQSLDECLKMVLEEL